MDKAAILPSSRSIHEIPLDHDLNRFFIITRLFQSAQTPGGDIRHGAPSSSSFARARMASGCHLPVSSLKRIVATLSSEQTVGSDIFRSSFVLFILCVVNGWAGWMAALVALFIMVR